MSLRGKHVSSTQVAKSTPFDNSTNGFASTNVQAAIEEVKSPPNGVSPGFIFSKSGGSGVGAYLKTGEVLTSNTGQLIRGLNYITQINASTSANQTNAGGATLQLQRRTGLNTFVDIAGATVNIPNGSFSATHTGLSISIGSDWEISCYNTGPGNVSDCVVTLFVTPQ
jgi:hypothetical protein